MATHTHNCCQKQKLKRGLWSPDEDEKLLACIMQHGAGSWSSVPELAGIQRCGKSCRLRWINYLRPGLKRGSFSPLEEKRIIELHEIFGNKWSKIASYLPGRTDNEIKNLWNSCLKKRIEKKEPQNDPQASNAANADAETKPERQKSPIRACHMATASSPCMPSRPIFPFLHGEFVDTKKSRGNMFQASHDMVLKSHLEKLPIQGFSGRDPTDKANNSKQIIFSQQDEAMDSIDMPRQDIEQFSFSLAQLPLHSRLQSIELMNHAVTFASDHTVQMADRPRMSIEAMEASQGVGLLQLQTARNHRLPFESSQLNNNSTLLWNDFVNSHIGGPDSYGESPRKQVFCTNTDHKAARGNGYSLKNHQQSDDSSDASFAMNYFTPNLCELGSVNQSPSTTCSDGSPTEIPALLDYQDVEFWLNEACHKIIDGYKISSL